MPTGTVSKTYACQDRGNCGKSMKNSMPEFIPSWTIVSTAGTAGSFLPFVCWKQDEKNIVTDSSGVKSLVNCTSQQKLDTNFKYYFSINLISVQYGASFATFLSG